MFRRDRGGWSHKGQKDRFGGASFCELPPPHFSIFGIPPPGHLWRSTPRCGVPTANLGARIDLKVDKGGGGSFFAGRGGGRRRHLSAYPPSTAVSCCPLKLMAQPRVSRLPLRVTSGSGGGVTRHAVSFRAFQRQEDPLPRRPQLKAPAIGHVIGHFAERNVAEDQGIGSMCVDPS